METSESSSPIFDSMSATTGVVIVEVDDDQPDAEQATGDDQP
ncbi:hypothetical protein [Microbacterium candidum]|uniref:Uncharacterized protein n=1 Tax=Microbacterium candidum TaxID=3041922 RepID=A0ABT7MWE5_9MICO|nr:hypothetical protein [Microbacterium sp. ASV49]MDL9978770.1 hypothetical protein [Microbacterium sp. ASV49]